MSSLKKNKLKKDHSSMSWFYVLTEIGRVVINTGENKFTDFRKVNEPVKCNFI